MATLIYVGTSSREVGRCDAKCYNAKGPVCKCCCGGANHGVGLRQAVENTRVIPSHELLKWAKQQEPSGSKFTIKTQGSLPLFEV